MPKILIDGHYKLNIEYYIKKLISDDVGIYHNVNENIREGEGDSPSLDYLNYLNYLKISTCCNDLNHDLNMDKLIIHNKSPYSYKFLNNLDIDTFCWTPDIIIYLFTNNYDYFNESDRACDLKLDIMSDDMICQYTLYKINGNDEAQIVYDNICEIISNTIFYSSNTGIENVQNQYI